MKFAGNGGTISIPVNRSPSTNTSSTNTPSTNTSTPAGGSSPVYTLPPATGTGVVAAGTLIPLNYIFIGLLVLIVAIIGVMLI